MLVIGGQALPHGMASDGTDLFFADEGAGVNNGTVQRIPVGGGSATPIASGQSVPVDVVVDANNVYWANAGDGSVWKSDKTTPNPIKLAGPSGQGHATHLRVDATNVYFTDHTSGLVKRVPIAGGNVTTMTTQVGGVGYIAIDSKNAYFGAYPQNKAAILSIDLGATAAAPTPVISSGLAYINGVETDGTSLWYAEQSNVQPYKPSTGEVHRATVAGQNDATLATKQNGPNCIAVDSTSVYWINAGGGMISKTGK